MTRSDRDRLDLTSANNVTHIGGNFLDTAVTCG